MALTKSFSSQAYQGRAGQGPQFGNILLGATDQLGEFAQKDEDEAKTIATNEVFARIAQGEAVEDVLQTTDPALVDAASLLKFQDEHNASVSGLAVDQANIRSSDASANFNVARTAEVGPNAKAQRSLWEQQRQEAKAKAERQGTLAEREAADYADGVRIKGSVKKLNDWYFNGGFDGEISQEFDDTIDTTTMTPENAALAKKVWTKNRKIEIENAPDFMLGIANRYGLTPGEFTGKDSKGNFNSELGRQYAGQVDAAAAAEIEQARIDHEANKAYQTGVDEYLGGKAESGHITANGISFGPTLNKISGPDADTLATNAGFNLKSGKKGNPKHRQVIDTLKARVKDQESYEYVLGLLRTREGDIGDNLTAIIEETHQAMKGAATQHVADRSASLADGRSATQIMEEFMESLASLDQPPTPEQSADEKKLVEALEAPGYNLPAKPETIEGQVTAIKTQIAKAQEDIDGLSPETKENLRIPLARIAKDMERINAPDVEYHNKKKFAAQMTGRLNRILEAEAKKLKKEKAIADKKADADTSRAEQQALAAALIAAQ